MCVKVIIVTPSIVSAAAGAPLGTVPIPHFTPPPLPLPGTLREDADALCGRSVTDGAFWLC